MAETNEQIFKRIEKRFSNGFHQWLGVRLTAVEDEWVEIECPWRDEFEGAPGTCQGGVLATLIDMAAEYAIAARLGDPVPTINLRVDYHIPVRPGQLVARARVVKPGATVTTAETRILDFEGKLVCSGRGSFFSATLPRRT